MTTYPKAENKIRVLHITFRSDIGGGPKHILYLLHQIKDNLVPVNPYVCAPRGECYDKFREHSDGIFRLWGPFFYIFNLARIVLFCRKNAIDIIHSHGRGAGFYSRIAKQFLALKIVHTLHGAHKPRSLGSWFKLAVDRALRPLTDFFICVSADECQQAKELGLVTPAKTAVIVNAVNYRTIDTAFEGFSKDSKSADGTLQIGMAGELTWHKGWDLLLHSIYSNFDRLVMDNVRFIIAGDGRLRNQLGRLVKDRNLTDMVTFSGVAQDLTEFLADKHVFLSFSRGEGLPLSVLEAMSSRLPCILSDVVGHRSFVNDNGENCVLLFDPKNPSDFYDKLKVLYDPEQRKKYGSLGRKLVELNHDPNDWISKTVSIYQRLRFQSDNESKRILTSL